LTADVNKSSSSLSALCVLTTPFPPRDSPVRVGGKVHVPANTAKCKNHEMQEPPDEMQESRNASARRLTGGVCTGSFVAANIFAKHLVDPGRETGGGRRDETCLE
jgi:hypothetical protein